MTAEKKAPERLAPLDALRGLAALAVAIFSHYQHFGGDKKTYPYNDIRVFNWLYENSWLFVDFFFLLSGIVLTLRYYEPLSNKKVGGMEFFLLRTSRLYPLHFATLMWCAIIEWYLLANGKPQVIYQHNDLYHFILNLFYLHWGWFEEGLSYNAPSWSVCAEVFVYILFYAFLLKPKRYVLSSVIAIFVGLAVLKTNFAFPLFNENIARALVGFFLGSIMFLGIRKVDAAGYGRGLTYATTTSLVIGCALTYVIGYAQWIGRMPLHHLIGLFPLVIVVSLRVRWLAAILSWRPLTFLGDISYSVYMVHVPLQMLFLSVCAAKQIPIITTDHTLILSTRRSSSSSPR